MVAIATLIDAQNEAQRAGLGLFHGTKVSREHLMREGLKPGSQTSPELHEFVQLAWAALGPAMTPPYDVNDPVDIRDFHSSDVQFSLKLARGDWRYDGVAFALDRLSADGYARDGSEALRGAASLRVLMRNRHPDVLHRLREGVSGDVVERALNIIDAPSLSGDSIAVLVKMPPKGYFFTMNEPHKPVLELAERAPGFFKVQEILFSETIPADCFRLEEPPPIRI